MNTAADQPHQLSFQPNDSFSPGSSSASSNFPYQQAVPAQQVQQSVNDQSHAKTDTFLINDGLPSAEQHEAITILQNIPSDIIFAWLHGFRSILRGEVWSHYENLTPEQRRGVSALRDCSDDLILTWLNIPVWERSSGIIEESHNVRDTRNLSIDRVTASFLGHSPYSLSDPSIHTTPRNQDFHGHTTSLRARSTPAATSKDHYHWCTICEHPAIIKTCDGYKRHMREHETYYFCIPQDSVVDTRDGPKCAVCGVFNPDPKHLNIHNVPGCIHKTFGRQGLIIKHYEGQHNIDNGSELANQSRYTTRKKYFPCGFCATLFDSVNEQINHIDAIHYRLSEHINSWDPNKAIRALLSQPGVSERWRSALAAVPNCQESLFTWDPEIVQTLQHRLEMSQEPPDVLCRVAIAESYYGGSERHHVGPMQATNLTDLRMNPSQSIQTIQHQVGLSQVPSVPNPDSTSHFSQAVPSAMHSQLPMLSWNGPYDPKLNAIREDQPATQLASKTFKSSSSAAYHHAKNRTQPHTPSSSTENFMEQHRPAFVPQIMSASGEPRASEGQFGVLNSSRSGRQSQGMSSSLTTNPHVNKLADPHNYSAQARVGYFHPPMATQSGASPLSPTYPPSQSGQTENPFSSRRQSYSAAQNLSQETTDDMDTAPRQIQRFAHDQDYSQDQRKYR